MKNFIIIIFTIISYNCFSQADAVTIVLHDSTLWLKNFTTNDSLKLNNRVPSIAGQAGKVLATNGVGYAWTLPADLFDTTSIYTAIGAKLSTATASATYQLIGTYATGSGSATGTNTGDNSINTLYSGLAASKQDALVSGTNIKTINGTTLLGSGNLGISGTSTSTYVNLASPFSSTITTEAAVTGWNFAVTSGKAYRVEVIALFQTAATTTGGELGFFLTASGAGTIVGSAEAGLVTTAANSSLSQQISAIGAADLAGSNMITTGVSTINTPQYFKSTVIFICTVSGTFNVGWASEVGTSAAQLNAGSSLIYQVLN